MSAKAIVDTPRVTSTKFPHLTSADCGRSDEHIDSSTTSLPKTKFILHTHSKTGIMTVAPPISEGHNHNENIQLLQEQHDSFRPTKAYNGSCLNRKIHSQGKWSSIPRGFGVLTDAGQIPTMWISPTGNRKAKHQLRIIINWEISGLSTKNTNQLRPFLHRLFLKDDPDTHPGLLDGQVVNILHFTCICHHI